jgi:hypothetical protein
MEWLADKAILIGSVGISLLAVVFSLTPVFV